MAYAFTGNGRFLSKAAVDDKGNANLSLPASRSRQEFRIVAGPEASDETPSLSELTRRGANTSYVQVSADSKVSPVTFSISSDIWLCWIRRCFVKGQLLKRIYSSGIAIDYPVCGAQVQIWEVERIWLIIRQLTDVQLKTISEYLINPQPLPPGPPDPGPESLARLGKLEVAQPIQTGKQYTATSPEFDVLHTAAASGNLSQLRQGLLTVDESAVRFLICWLFPYWITKWQVGTLTTDRCGNFEGYIFVGCYETPNLYFTATASFYGFTITIYDPQPVRCYTHWNYQCGTEVTLYTTSIFAPLCSPCQQVDAPENYVLIRALGNVQLNNIYGTSVALSGATTSDNIGQVADLYGAGLDSPFGGLVLPRFEFDSSLREFNIAKYYRVRYRQGTTGSFADLTGNVGRKYNHFVGTDLVTSPYPLGPNVVGSVPNLFEIPPALPPEGDWAFPDPPVDLANAQFPTTDLPSAVVGGTHGKYQLEITLFDASGNEVNIVTAGIRYFVPTTTDPDGTIHTADASTLGLVNGNAFIMTVHVDNRSTFGSLGTPALDGNPADSCGVFRYGPGPSGTVTIPYTATHPDNFAIYTYRLSRGATPLTPPTTSGNQVSAATDPAIVSMSVLSLLTQPDGTICDIAGFAEDLYVSALATDGWNRLSGYDSNPPPRAFVLAPIVSHS